VLAVRRCSVILHDLLTLGAGLVYIRYSFGMSSESDAALTPNRPLQQSNAPSAIINF
jgi:hypothetical protein